jgi:hypothetical protein
VVQRRSRAAPDQADDISDGNPVMKIAPADKSKKPSAELSMSRVSERAWEIAYLPEPNHAWRIRPNSGDTKETHRQGGPPAGPGEDGPEKDDPSKRKAATVSRTMAKPGYVQIIELLALAALRSYSD